MSDEVSIIIPTYNRAHLISRAIQSVLNQTYQNFEVIVVDDGSTDNTREVIKRFQRRDSRIRYIRHDINKGVSAAKNTGIKSAKGKYIAFIGDDDEWFASKLKKQVALLQKSGNNVGIVHTNCYINNGQKLTIFNKNYPFDQSFKRILEGNFIADFTCLIKQECFDEVGYFDEQIPCGEDWEFHIRTLRRYRYAYIHEPLAVMYWKNENTTRLSDDLRKTTKGLEYIIFKHWKEFEKYPKILSKHLCVLGMKMDSLGERKLAKWYLSEAFTIFPLCLPSVLYFYTQITMSKKLRKKLPVKLKDLSKTFDEF
ncbi:MAG: glycosyltransferase, partial [Nitrososphaeria archaeon]